MEEGMESPLFLLVNSQFVCLTDRIRKTCASDTEVRTCEFAYMRREALVNQMDF